MTHPLEAIVQAMEKGDCGEVIDLLAPLDEFERRSLADPLLGFEEDFLYPQRSDSAANERYNAFRVALFGVLSVRQLESLPPGHGWIRASADLGGRNRFEVLRPRSKDFLGAWCNSWLTSDNLVCEFAVAAIHAGVCVGPEQPTEAEELARCHRKLLRIPEHVVPDGTLLADYLESTPWLLTWPLELLLEREGSGDASLAAHDKFVRDDRSWAHAMRELAARGVLDRDWLLNRTLDALARDFAAFRAGWFQRLHDALQPTEGEVASRQERYLSLLGCQARTTLSFALGHLSAIDRACSLDERRFLNGIGPALVDRTKKTPLAALRIVERIAARSPELVPACGAAAVVGLGHSNADVQERTLKLLESLAGGLDAEALAAARDALPLVATKLSARARQLLGEEPRGVSHAAPEPVADTKAARALPGSVRARFGIDELLGAAPDTFPAPLAGEGRLPLPPVGPPVQPIETHDELALEALAHLEEPHDLLREERLLDGVLRLPRPGPGVTVRQNLIDGIDREARRPWGESYGTGRGSSERFAPVLAAWVGLERHVYPHASSRHPALEVLNQRLREAAAGAGRTPTGLASLPQFGEGWIAGTESERTPIGPGDEAILKSRRLNTHAKTPSTPTPRAASSWDLSIFQRSGKDWHREWIGRGRGAEEVEAAAPLGLLDDPPQSGRLWAYTHDSFDDPLTIRSAASLCLHSPEAFSHVATRALSENIDFDTAYWHHHCLLEPLLRRDVVLGKFGHTHLAVGLACKETQERALAIDACIEAALDGRADARALGEAMRWTLFTQLGRAQRWAGALREVLDVSPLHAVFVQRTLVEALRGPGVPVPHERPDALTLLRPHGLAGLLELLVEATARTGLSVDDEATQSYLGTLRGSSKGAKLAKQALSFDLSDASEAVLAEARALALERRIELATEAAECALRTTADPRSG